MFIFLPMDAQYSFMWNIEHRCLLTLLYINSIYGNARWMNGHYLRSLPSDELTKAIGEHWKSAGILNESQGGFVEVSEPPSWNRKRGNKYMSDMLASVWNMWCPHPGSSHCCWQAVEIHDQNALPTLDNPTQIVWNSSFNQSADWLLYVTNWEL